jgi:hypothetical protein
MPCGRFSGVDARAFAVACLGMLAATGYVSVLSGDFDRLVGFFSGIEATPTVGVFLVETHVAGW